MGFFSQENRERGLANSAAYIENLKKDYKGETGIGGARGFSPYVTDASGEQYSRGIVTTGARGSVGSGNTNWMVNPDTGQEEMALAGPDGKYYLPSDLIKTFGSLENAGKVAGAAYPDAAPGTMFGWSMAQQGDNFLGTEDDLKDFVEHAGPLVAGYFGGGALLGGEAAAGAAAGDATIAGGEGVLAGTSGTEAAATGTAASTTGGAVGDWWTELGLTAADVGEAGASSGDWWTQYGLTADDVGATAGTTGAAASSSGIDLAGLAKQFGPGVVSALLRAAPGLAGAYASNKQTGALQDLAGKYAEYGAPSRGRYEASMTPGFDPNSIPGYAGALDTSSKNILARLSATGGNPYGNPSGLVEANKAIVSGTALPAIQEYQRLNAGTGFGTTLNSAGAMSSAAIGSNANIYNALGGAAADAFNPPKSLAEQWADLKKAGLA